MESNTSSQPKFPDSKYSWRKWC